MLKNSYFWILVLSTILNEAVAQTQNSLPVAKTASLATISADQNKKEALAKKLIEVSGAGSTIQKNHEAAEQYITRPAVGKTDKETAALKTAALNSKVEYNAQKEKLLNEANKALVIELTKRFTAQEIQYLIDINNYQTFKKYHAFLESDTFYHISGRSIHAAREILSQQKAKLLKQP